MILIIDMNYEKDSLGYYEFVMPIASVVKGMQDYEVKHFSEVSDADKYERIILSGTTLKDMEFAKKIHKFEWMKGCERPILGICAGMEAIGLVFGSRLKKCQEIGMAQVETTRPNPLFSSRFKAYELHNFSITPSRDFDILANSENCIQAVKHRYKNIFGVVFHPEVRNKEILERFVST